MFARPDVWRPWAVAAALCVPTLAILMPHEAHAESMRASFYGAESGTRTASGARFLPMGLSAAHLTYPFGTRLRVCYRSCAIVVVNDRGPFKPGRALDLSRGAARAIGMEAVGVATIDVERLN